jgi:hypothetical protein
VFCIPCIFSILQYLFHSTPYRFLFHPTDTYFTLSHNLIRSQCQSQYRGRVVSTQKVQGWKRPTAWRSDTLIQVTYDLLTQYRKMQQPSI